MNGPDQDVDGNSSEPQGRELCLYQAQGLDEDFLRAIERLEREALLTPPASALHRRGFLDRPHWRSSAVSSPPKWTSFRPAVLIGGVAAFLSLGIAFVAVNPVRLALTGFSVADVPAQFRDSFASVPEDEVRTATSDATRSAEQIPTTSPDATRPVGEADLNQVPSAPPSVAQTQFAAVAQPPAAATPSVASDHIGEGEIAPLLQRSRELAAVGDIASARLILGRLVRAGNLEAMVNLASTFDPAALAQMRVIGSWSDRAKAQELYQMAAQAGSIQAQARLKDPAFQSKK
jgi:hypothetical protein